MLTQYTVVAQVCFCVHMHVYHICKQKLIFYVFQQDLSNEIAQTQYMFLYHIRSAGQGLVQLFFSSAVQSFFNCAPPKELYPEKENIYQAGMLRKVYVKVYISLHNITDMHNVLLLYELLYHSDSNLLL